MKRKAKAVWNGTGLEGKGTLSTTSGVLNDTPFSFTTRFKNEDGKQGTNPEELIGAAHAGCFSMALSFGLTNAGFPPEQIQTDAEVSLEKVEDKNRVTGIHLITRVKAPNISADQFATIAEETKKNCPVSVALSATPITLDAQLV